MIYCIVASDKIEQLNRSIMRLLRPSHLRDANYITDFYCNIITHPLDGRTCLALPEEETVPIHIEADGVELQAMMAIFVTDGAITQQEADDITAAVELYAGQRVTIANLIPPSWQGNVLTQAQAEADGWFANQEII